MQLNTSIFIYYKYKHPECVVASQLSFMDHRMSHSVYLAGKITDLVHFSLNCKKSLEMIHSCFAN